MPVIDMISTGKRITALQKEKGITAKDIQKACGFSGVQAVYAWKSGKSMPSLDNLVILASIFNVTLNDIVVTK